MLVSGRGVVLSSVKYGDSSVICRIFTRQHGLTAFLIQGVYRKKARISYSYLQPFSLLDMVYYYKENRQLQKVKEVKAHPALNNLQTNVVKTSVALFAVEALGNVLGDNEHDEDMFQWLQSFVLELDAAENVHPLLPHQFLLQLTMRLGFLPANGPGEYFNISEGGFYRSPESEGRFMPLEESKLLKQLLEGSAALQVPSATTRHRLLDQLMLYFEKHSSAFRPLKSLKVLHDVFS